MAKEENKIEEIKVEEIPKATENPTEEKEGIIKTSIKWGLKVLKLLVVGGAGYLLGKAPWKKDEDEPAHEEKTEE